MKKQMQILLVEAYDGDAKVIQEILENNVTDGKVIRVKNAEEALDYLNNGQFAWPCVIILDLYLPKINGTEFLKILKADEVLKMIPIVVLTRYSRKIKECFSLGAAGYMIKPIEYKEYETKIKTIMNYWSTCELPGAGI